MENEFGIKVHHTIEPKRKLEFNKWVEKFNVSAMYQKTDADACQIMEDYDFKKIYKKDKKTFGIIHRLLNFA